jgi:hypothetical protein
VDTGRDREWQERVRGMVRAELARRNISYVDLAERLRAMNIIDGPKNLSNKINKGAFSAAFFFQVMHAIGVKTINLED